MKINKKIISLFIVFPALVLSQSCTNLNEETYNIIPQDKFGKTPQQVATIIGPAYSSLQGIAWGYYDMNISVTTDCAIAPTRGTDWYDGGQWQELAKHTWTSVNADIWSSWDFCFKGISTVNQILFQLSQSANITNKETTIAQLKGVRAFYYYCLIDLYGNVPIVTDFTDVDPPKQSSRADVFDFTVKELKEIENLVPKEYNAETYGKITQGVVQTLLAKMYLNAVVWKGTPMWQDAITYCDKVIASGQYIIEPDWKSNFSAHNEGSKENIFVVPFDQNCGNFMLADETLHYKSVLTFGLNSGPWNGFCGLPEYINAYASNDPRKAGSFLWGPQYNGQTGELLTTGSGDPLNFTIDVPSLESASQADGARCFKYEFEKGATDNMNNDFVVFRLADIYLMKAEAILRAGESQADALSLVNTIRERAFKNADNNLRSVTLDEVLAERAFEFAWEGPRRQDLIRFEIAGGKKYWTMPWRFKPETSAKTFLFPIPLAAIDVNPNLKQNPGY